MKIKSRVQNSYLKYVFFLFAFIFLKFNFYSSAWAVELADVVQFQLIQLDVNTNQLSLRLKTKNNFKIYQDNLSFERSSPNSFPEVLSYAASPKATLVYDQFSDTDKYVLENATTLYLTGSENIEFGDALKISVQACSVDVCLLPSVLYLKIDKGAVSSKDNHSSSMQINTQMSAPFANKNHANIEESKKFSSDASITKSAKMSFSELVLKYLQTGSIFLFPILFLAGLLTNLTPCVYPMIPITLSVMNQFGKNQKAPVKLALIYMLGMVITYSLLGVGAAMTGQVFGSQLSSPVFNFIIATIMILLGLAMLDVFDLSILQRLSYKIPFSNKSPVLAVGTMGAVSGLVAAPCTGPILSMILVLIAQTREPFIGFTYMLCYAIGFGIPYVFLGVLSQKLNKLPKMNKTSTFIKLFFACLMFALALYFLRTFLTDFEIFNIFYVKPTGLEIFTLCILLLVFIGIKKSKTKIFNFIRSVGIVFSITLLCLWLTLWVSNAFSVPNAVKNTQVFENSLESSDIAWMTNLEDATQKAIKSNKKIIVDIWADWCAACLEMEHTTWKDKQIIQIIQKKYIPVKIDYTKPTNRTSELVTQWDIVGLPAVLIFDPTSLKKPLETNQGLVKTSKLIEQLNKY